MAPSFLARMRQGSQTLNKKASTSSISLPLSVQQQQQIHSNKNGAVHYTTGATMICSSCPGADMKNPCQHMTMCPVCPSADSQAPCPHMMACTICPPLAERRTPCKHKIACMTCPSANMRNPCEHMPACAVCPDADMRNPCSHMTICTICPVPAERKMPCQHMATCPMCPSADMQSPCQHMDNHNQSLKAPERIPGKSLRKRFFSKSGVPMATMPRPMTMNMDEMDTTPSAKDKIKSMMLPNGGVDMGMVLQAIEQRFTDEFEESRMESAIQLNRSIGKQRSMYQWQESSEPPFPPHCKLVPKDARVGLMSMFDMSKLISAAVSFMPEIPKGLSSFLYGEPMGPTMANLEERMKILTKQGKNIGSVPSIANRPDWYSDAVFAQQRFTGPNPTSICRASTEWIQRFKITANKQGNKAMYTMLNSMSADMMYIQDYSHFRNACGAAPTTVLQSSDGTRFACASVTLFQLTREGTLHPMGIVLDYQNSMDSSVCIFNRRMGPEDSTEFEAKDWPWRYAKMCHQVSDWTQHELAVHLNDCHFVMEATIVACQRAFPNNHVVYNMLAPHWHQTLSLNAASRSGLVPEYINSINGFTSSQTYAFIMDAYKRFNWTAHYIPNDLKRRGFGPDQMDSKMMHNYVWAKNMSLMWNVLHKFVSNMLATVYKTDDDVMRDQAVQDWCAEMHSPTGGQMASFPDIRTIEDLTNAVTMCIHIASPQHNSINYLQGYYMSFVPNKPASLMAPLPATLSELMQYNEREMMAALPIRDQRIWLMSSQMAHMLSHPPAEEHTIVVYAQNLEREARVKKGPKWQQVEKAAREFHDDLMGLGADFDMHGQMMDDQVLPYRVLDPMELAVSILI